MEETKPKKRSGYEIFSTAWNKKFEPTYEELQTVNSFLFMRMLSNDPIGAMIANEINIRSEIPIELQYLLVRDKIPDKVKFINFNRKDKKLNEKYIDLVSKHYKINTKTAEEYIELMSEEDLEELWNDYNRVGIQKG